MQSEIIVSVVMPTHNRRGDLERAIRSVLQQTLREFEIIVIDNHSNDGTDEMIASLNNDRIRVVKIHNEGIIAASRNKGIEEARGKYIAFLDSDDWWTPEKLKVSVNALNHANDVVYHELWVVSSEASEAKRRPIGVRPLLKPVFMDLIEKAGAIATSSVVVRTELIRQVNGFSEDKELVVVEDYDCWLRIAKLSDRFYCIPGSYGFYWDGVMNQSRNAQRVLTANTKLFVMYLNPSIRGNKLLPVWYLYAMGRAHYVLGNTKRARQMLSPILFRNAPLIIKSKVLWMLFFKQCIDKHV